MSPGRLSPGHPALGNPPRVCTHRAPHGESVSLGSQSEFLPRKVQMNTTSQLGLFFFKSSHPSTELGQALIYCPTQNHPHSVHSVPGLLRKS